MVNLTGHEAGNGGYRQGTPTARRPLLYSERVHERHRGALPGGEVAPGTFRPDNAQPTIHFLTFPAFVILSRCHSSHPRKERQMGNLAPGETLRTLKGERAHVRTKLATLDKAIAGLRELAGTNWTSNGRRKKRTLSAAARRKIATAQKLRWAEVRRERTTKA